jgi:hypothetical protein
MSRTTRHSRFASSGRIDRFAIYGFFRLMQTPGEQLPLLIHGARAVLNRAKQMAKVDPSPLNHGGLDELGDSGT